MSLVAYGSSDESDNEDEISNGENDKVQQSVKCSTANSKDCSENNSELVSQVNNFSTNEKQDLDNDFKLDLKAIPKPKLASVNIQEIQEEIDEVPCLGKVNYSTLENPPKKKKEPVRISVPSLSEVNFYHLKLDLTLFYI